MLVPGTYIVLNIEIIYFIEFLLCQFLAQQLCIRDTDFARAMAKIHTRDLLKTIVKNEGSRARNPDSRFL